MDDGRWRRRIGPFFSRAVLVISLFHAAAGAHSVAASPKVAFDVSQAIECHDATPDTFASANPDEKLIEITFQVSILLLEGDQADIEELMVTLVSPERRLRMVDFSPQTQLVSDVVGPVEKVDTRQTERSITASLGGTLSSTYGVGSVQVSPSAGAGNTRREVSTETYKQLPPKQTVVVSGTTHAGHGVFFKLKPTGRISLEGTKQFSCRCVVPRTWRGDWALLTCRARSHSKTLFVENVKPCGYRRVPVALYLHGDSLAKQAATALVRAHAGPVAAVPPPRRVGPDWSHVVLKPILGDRASARPQAHLAAATTPGGRDREPARRPEPPATAASAHRDASGTLDEAVAALRQLSGAQAASAE